MREGVKWSFASVGALTWVADAAEGQGRDGAMVESVVDGGASGCNFIKNWKIIVSYSDLEKKYIEVKEDERSWSPWDDRNLDSLFVVSAFDPKA